MPEMFLDWREPAPLETLRLTHHLPAHHGRDFSLLPGKPCTQRHRLPDKDRLGRLTEHRLEPAQVVGGAQSRTT